jgi:hypothetical protein
VLVLPCKFLDTLLIGHLRLCSGPVGLESERGRGFGGYQLSVLLFYVLEHFLIFLELLKLKSLFLHYFLEVVKGVIKVGGFT